MPNTKTNPKRRPRSKREANPVDELAQELTLALTLDRSSLLMVVAQTDALRQHAAGELAAKLDTLGYSVRTLYADRVADGDIPMAIRKDTRRAKKIFFVWNLQPGGDPALRALNIRREYFSQLRARVVFWLTPEEEVALARQATDFWSFRHRTVHLA